jgi:hypothetical protein
VIHDAKPPLKFIPQHFSPLILQIAHGLLPLVLRFRTRSWLRGGICEVKTENAEILVKLYQQFQTGKIRFLMAFHHPEVEDPLCLLHLMSRVVPQVAREQGISLKYPIHSHFLYDRGMTIWAGDWLGWLFSRAGGIPIRRGKTLDRLALKNARELFANGRFPMAVAPEGANNGHGEIVSSLELGVAQLGFWCVEDLVKANRNEEVLIVPISILYTYLKPPWSQLDRLLSQLETDSGLMPQPLPSSHLSDPKNFLYPRLLKLGEHILGQMEDFYRRFYHQTIPSTDIPLAAGVCPNQVLTNRIQNLLDIALKVAEDYFGISSQGTISKRCRRLEEAGWNAIYREDIADIQRIPPLQRGLADWIAQEADLRLKHMRLVESFVAVTGMYVKEKPTPERFAETILILFDLMARIKGQKIPRRPFLGKRAAKITVGKPISLNERWKAYQPNRKAAKQTIADLTQDLQIALENLI